jgi:hypothetical protein
LTIDPADPTVRQVANQWGSPDQPLTLNRSVTHATSGTAPLDALAVELKEDG